MTNIIITMPDLKKEGNAALKEYYRKEKGLLYFRVSMLPKRCKVGEYCYIVCNGEFIGMHKIVAMGFLNEESAQMLSDGNWHKGKYIIRDGTTFFEDNRHIMMRGFQGFRYI